jgi:hypothetical protein
MAKGDVIARRAAEVIATGPPADRLAGHPQHLAAIQRAPREAWPGLIEHVLSASPTLEELREKVAEVSPPREPVEPQSRRKKAEEDEDEEDDDEEAVKADDEG